MEHAYFKKLENLSVDTHLELDTVIDHLAFNDQGLIPVITQDATSKIVLMFAWMNKESLHKTLTSKYMTYWSRSRQNFWVKGETSGHTQALVSMSFDCDGDVVLCLVNQIGAACHTERSNCFYLVVDEEQRQVTIQSRKLQLA